MADIRNEGYMPNPLNSLRSLFSYSPETRVRTGTASANPEWGYNGELSDEKPTPLKKYKLPPYPKDDDKVAPLPPDNTWMGPPDFTNINKPSGSEAPVNALPTLPGYDGGYGEAAQSDYATRMNNVANIYNPAKERNDVILNQLMNDSSGGSTAAALRLNAIFGNLLPAQQKLAAEHAGQIAAISPNQFEARRYGMEPRTRALGEVFKEKLPSTQAELALRTQQAEHAKQSGVHSQELAKSEIIKRRLLQQSAREKGTGVPVGLSPKERMDALSKIYQIPDEKARLAALEMLNKYKDVSKKPETALDLASILGTGE